jgi:AcrR family transcriptional regulator
MPPKAKFTRAQLQAAALALVDAEGLAGLSMRTLASSLGTGPMTLYNYVRDRGDLDALVVEAVMAEVKLPGDRRGDLAHGAPPSQRHPARPHPAHAARNHARLGRGAAARAGT